MRRRTSVQVRLSLFVTSMSKISFQTSWNRCFAWQCMSLKDLSSMMWSYITSSPWVKLKPIYGSCWIKSVNSAIIESNFQTGSSIFQSKKRRPISRLQLLKQSQNIERRKKRQRQPIKLKLLTKLASQKKYWMQLKKLWMQLKKPYKLLKSRRLNSIKLILMKMTLRS